MSQLLIDRELLQRILDSHFELEAENRAYLGFAQFGIRKNPVAGQRYFETLAEQKAKELSQMEGHYRILKETLSGQDDDAFLASLSAKFPPR